MKRLQLFELEDFSWFPDFIRSPMTRLLQAMNKLMGMDEAIAVLLQRVIRETKIKTIVDLGSGSGGVMPLVHERLVAMSETSDIKLVLTDLHPSNTALQKYNQSHESISFHSESVDATAVNNLLQGIKTMINAFHHMDPDTAKAILKAAQDRAEPLLIFEMQENKVPTLIWGLFLPLGLLITFIMALVLTPFSRPLTFSQLIFTYLIPIIPLCFAWDGQMSYARMYSMNDLDQLFEGLGNESYTWEKGVGCKMNGKSIGTYLLGIPKAK